MGIDIDFQVKIIQTIQSHDQAIFLSVGQEPASAYDRDFFSLIQVIKFIQRQDTTSLQIK